ncbi:3-dehydroquinate synthase [Candidatus Nephthysia bennettiae]|uniref:3-dehydroquinate synthase n=1 Tax=Candidatus Nephthysia bennettiae TaxID=3127016 RepID=A0A934NFQ3_9BACT|nr:3-dehydroquinate synthase [Candidatus Dormibacteraeota bacterium]MBJ7611170.1 3-dehydroquinate synthase [Candidatus Dormibacteraeota bacterium]
MGRVTVKVPGHPYPVLVGRGALMELPRLVRDLGCFSAAVVTDGSVGPVWAQPVVEGLLGVGVRAHPFQVEAGEGAKSLATLERVLGFFEDVELDRSAVVVALGGGTVGDLAGFAAAVWLRGVRCVQVPTTLLAMVDSSVGGKSGVNTARTKNGIGSITQPVAVVSDPATLSTLPDDQYLAAFGEVAKYAVAMDAELVAELETETESLLGRREDVLEPVITRCVQLKAGVVASDERETGRRALLNYGHTVGHALESACGYSAAHGRAVAFGMRAAARIAERSQLCDGALVARQDRLLEAFGLPGPLPQVSAESVLAALPRDKKSRGGRPRWVLPREMGRAEFGISVPDPVVAEVVRCLLP